MTSITLFSGGAAHGLVKAMTPAFTAATGYSIAGEFGAVGGFKSRLIDGAAADCVILTDAIVADLEARGIAKPGGNVAVGPVATAVAIRQGGAVPPLATAADLAAAMRGASAIYFPDPVLATAGIHFANVLKRLGIYEQTLDRHRTYPNGATAMAALAASQEPNPIGCTQATEIISTPGVRLIGSLPGDTGLSTIYVAGMIAKTQHAPVVRWLIDALASPEHAALRKSCGFGA